MCEDAGGTGTGSAIEDAGVLVGKTITVKADSNITCTFTNSKQLGSILVEKLQAGTTDVRIDGASFALDEDGDAGTTDDQTPIPAVEGEAGLYCIDDLLFDDYYVVETSAPSGYSDDSDVESVQVDSESTCAEAVAADPQVPDASFQNKKIPSIVTTATDSVTVGGTVKDTATLSGLYVPSGGLTGGDIVFTAYSDEACSVELFTDTFGDDEGEDVTGNGSYDSAEYTTENTGTIYWQASYTGDDYNTGVDGVCGDTTGGNDEQTDITKKQPSIVTDATDSVTVGGTVKDTATLSGLYVPSGGLTGGDIVFTAYSDEACSVELFTDTFGDDEGEDVTGNGSYDSAEYTTENTGTIYWKASYTGDDYNTGVDGVCGDTTAGNDEQTEVLKDSPTLDTTPVLLPNDTATLGGGFGTLGGKISFALFDTTDCSGNAIYDELDVDVTGAGDYSTTNTDVFITEDGTYSWEVTYTGDDNNDGAMSTCTQERYVVDVTPDPPQLAQQLVP